MKNLAVIFVVVSTWMIFSTGVSAEETPTVIQAHTCNYLDGKGPSDLDKGIDFWQSNLAKIDSPDVQNHFSSVVTPVVSSTGVDFLWLVWNQNMNQFARGTAAYAASAAGQAANERFQKMSKCTSNLWFSEQIHQGWQNERSDNANVMVAYGCKLHAGKTMDNVQAAEALWQELVAPDLNAVVFRLSPAIANTELDLAYLVYYDDLESFGKAATDGFTNAAAMPANMAFQQAIDCETGLYATRIVHRAPPTEN